MTMLRRIISILVGPAPAEDGASVVVSAMNDQSFLAEFVRLLREVDAEEAVSKPDAAEY